MKVREMRELSSEELNNRLAETRKELIEFKFQQSARKLESPAKLRVARRRLARLLTVQSEKVRGGQ